MKLTSDMGVWNVWAKVCFKFLACHLFSQPHCNRIQCKRRQNKAKKASWRAGTLVGGRVRAYFIKTHDLAPVTKLSLVFVFGVSCWLTLFEFHYLFSYQSVRIRSPAKSPTDTIQTQKIINYAPLFKATNIAVHMAYDYFSCFFAQHNINSC